VTLQMNLESYILGLRRDAGVLRLQKSSITEKGMRGWSRWGSMPFIETTAPWLRELNRRIDELDNIANAMEHGDPI
jgi:hypothetical protein